MRTTNNLLLGKVSEANMGNRAAVVFTNNHGEVSPAAYLHWQGGPESIYAFIAELDRRKVRAGDDYELARFTHIVGDFFDDKEATALSLGIMSGPNTIDITDEGLCALCHTADDNGVFVVNRCGKKMGVRRFLPVYDTNGCREVTPKIVEQERREAIKSEKHAAIFAKLITLRPKVSENG